LFSSFLIAVSLLLKLHYFSWQDKTWPDNWTAVTADGSWSAQFEHTMAVVENGVEVMTAKPQWDGVRDHIPDWNREWFQR
jgi:hypothetical protein